MEEINDREVIRTVKITGLIDEKSFREVQILYSQKLNAYVLHIKTNVIDEETCDNASYSIAKMVARKYLGAQDVEFLSPCVETPSDIPEAESYFLAIKWSLFFMIMWFT